MIPRGVESRTFWVLFWVPFWVPFWGLRLLAEWPHLFLPLLLLYNRFFFCWRNLGFESPPGLLGLLKKATPTQCLGLKGVGNEAYNDRCFPPPVSNERRGFSGGSIPTPFSTPLQPSWLCTFVELRPGKWVFHQQGTISIRFYFFWRIKETSQSIISAEIKAIIAVTSIQIGDETAWNA